MKDSVTVQFVVFWIHIAWLTLMGMNFGWLAAQYFELRRGRKERAQLDAKIQVVKDLLEGLERHNEATNRKRNS